MRFAYHLETAEKAFHSCLGKFVKEDHLVSQYSFALRDLPLFHHRIIEEAEQIRRRKLFEAAQEKMIEEAKAENMRAAGEWPTRADIKFRLNLTVDQPPSAPRMADGSLQLYGTEKVPKGWEDRY